MRIAIPATGTGSDQPSDERFGRCSHFAVYDTSADDWSFIPNPARQEAHGAGIVAARCLIEQRVDLVIGPPPGPNAVEVLEAAAIDFIPAPGTGAASVGELLEDWLKAQKTVP